MANTWLNDDGLFVKFGESQGNVAKGGEINKMDNVHSIEFTLDYTDALSATDAILGSVDADEDGSFGIVVPKGARIKGVEVLVETAFTSSGTIGTATLLLGTVLASDRSTEQDYNGFLTAAFVGSKLDAAGERNYQEVGTTGSGALIGTTLAANGVITCSNSQHGSHPYTAGRARIRLDYTYV